MYNNWFIKFTFALFFICLYFVFPFTCQAETLSRKLDTLINNNPVSNQSIISVSIRKAKTGEIIYQKNANLLLHTASTLKALTTPVAINYLGTDYHFKTSLLKDKKTNTYYLKLSADPLFTSNDLNSLMSAIKNQDLKNDRLIIDDSIIDNLPWGVGWMWDDENNTLMPKYNAYNINHNLISVKVSPTSINRKPSVTVLAPYQPTIENNALTSNKTNILVERKPWFSPETIFISGFSGKQIIKKIPAGSPENLFLSYLKESLKVYNINYFEPIKTGSVSSDAILISSINHNLLDIIAHTNQMSDNLSAETLLKISGHKYTGRQGTTINGLKALNAFYVNLNAPANLQEIVDGSGASHNDLCQTNWMTLALSKLTGTPFFSYYEKTLATPGNSGTLRNRLLNLKNRLYAKTGTLSGISGIIGYLNTESGNHYCFAILIQNYKGSSTPAKNLENHIVNTLSYY